MMRFLALIGMILTMPLAYAQDIVNYVPDNVPVVMSMNAENFSTKFDVEQLMELDMYKMMEQRANNTGDSMLLDYMSNLYTTPEEIGVSWKPRAYGYFQQVDSFMVAYFIMKITDIAKFESKFPMSEKIEKTNKISYIMPSKNPSSDNAILAWSKDVLSIVFVQGNDDFIHNSIPYTDTMRYEKIEKLTQEFGKTVQKVSIREVEKALKPAQKPISKVLNYQTFTKNKYDLGVWVNLEKLGELLQENQNSMPIPLQARQLQQFTNRLSGLQEGYFHTFLNLNKGEARLSTQSFMPARLDKLAQEMYAKKLDPKLFKYLKGKDALFYAGAAADIPKISEFAEEYYRMILEGDSIGDLILAGWDVLDIAIDQEALTGLLSGDMLLSITGVRNVKTTYTTYEYDDNYNATEVEKTRETPVPVMTALAKVGDMTNFNKILNLLEKTKVIEKKADYYVMPKAAEELGKFYIRIKEGIFIFTNDTDVISGKYKNGVSKSEQLAETHQKLLLKYSTVYNLDAERLLKKVEELGADEFSEKNKQQFQLLRDNVEFIRLQGASPEKNYETELIISFKDKEANFLHQLGKLLDAYAKL